MCSEFRMGPATSGHGLWNINKVSLKVNKSSIKMGWGPDRAKLG